MPRRPAAYPAAYREQLIALVRAGRSPKELAKGFEPSEQTIRNWLFQDSADRPRLPREPGRRSGRHDVSRVRRFGERVLRVAEAWAVGACAARCGTGRRRL